MRMRRGLGGDNASSASAPAWVSGEVFVVALALALAADVSGNCSGKLARSAVTSVVLPALSCGIGMTLKFIL